MTYYKKNITYFQKNAPHLYNILKKEKALFPLAMVESEDGNNFLMTYNNKTCHANSYLHQLEEFEDLFSNIDNNCKTIVLIGIANGEVFEFIKERYPNIESIFIIEPFLDIFNRFISGFDIVKSMYSLGQVTFVINQMGKESVQMVLGSIVHNFRDVGFVCQASYFAVMDTWLQEFKEIFIKCIYNMKIHYNTLHYSKLPWLKNSIYNIRHLDLMQESLEPFLKGKPVILVSAGPSLNKHLDKLKTLQNKAIIIAAGTSIKILSEAGIKPHFQIAIDKTDTELIYDEAFYRNSPNIPLLYSGTFASTVLEKYGGPSYFMMTTSDLVGRYVFEELKLPINYVVSGASVVIPALHFLYHAGCSPIVFVGQDMCFYDNELYAKGREKSQNEYDKKILIKKKDIYGNEVNTLKIYLQIKYDYEDVINKMDSTRMINATEGGLGIVGVVNRTLDDVIENELSNDMNLNMDELIRQTEIHSPISKKDRKACMLDILDQLDRIKAINNHTLEAMRNLTKDRECGIAIDKFWSKLEHIESEYNEKLNKHRFYKTVILQTIQVQLMAMKNKYSGKDKNTEASMINAEKFFYDICSEIELMCEALDSWINDAHFSGELSN